MFPSSLLRLVVAAMVVADTAQFQLPPPNCPYGGRRLPESSSVVFVSVGGTISKATPLTLSSPLSIQSSG